ncbi:hypothetical protein AAF712_008910 [Marasmius tenuissimus]|uniref:F-box domain-containing protein n=1 Tax=Marasmius tenuissimus TaxID=585030 RepID=A0ABR2ZTT7_9AGAR
MFSSFSPTNEVNRSEALDIQNDLHRKVESLNQKIFQLERERAVLNTLFNCNALWSKLPNEMLAKIFQHCVGADASGHALSGRAVTWVLARICRRWREIVISTPALWSIVRVNTEFRCRDPLQVIKTWIERSQHLLLSCMISLNDMDTTHGRYQTDEAAIFSLILDSHARWGHLYIQFGVRIDLYNKFLSNHYFAPHLQSIRIATPDHYDNITPERFLLGGRPQMFGLMAPKLADVSMNIMFPHESVVLPLPLSPTWQQLQTLQWTLVVHTPCHAFLQAVAAMPHLRNLFLKISGRMSLGHHTNNDTSTLTLAPLRRLEFSGPIDIVGGLMGLLRVPNLTDVSILDCPFEYPSSLQPLTDMLSRSSCRLERLNTSYKWDTALAHPNTTQLLSYLTTLRELHMDLSASGGFEQTLEYLQDTAVFPLLKELHLVIFVGAGELPGPILEGIADLAKARRQGDSQFSVLSIDTISYWGEPKPKLQATTPPFRKLLELQKDGLQLFGRIVDGRWHLSHPSSTHWGFEGDEQIRSRFGYPDELEDCRICKSPRSLGSFALILIDDFRTSRQKGLIDSAMKLRLEHLPCFPAPRR